MGKRISGKEKLVFIMSNHLVYYLLPIKNFAAPRPPQNFTLDTSLLHPPLSLSISLSLCLPPSFPHFLSVLILPKSLSLLYLSSVFNSLSLLPFLLLSLLLTSISLSLTLSLPPSLTPSLLPSQYKRSR